MAKVLHFLGRDFLSIRERTLSAFSNPGQSLAVPRLAREIALQSVSTSVRCQPHTNDRVNPLSFDRTRNSESRCFAESWPRLESEMKIEIVAPVAFHLDPFKTVSELLCLSP